MPSWWHFATSDGTPGHALITGAIIGTVLAAINHGDFILAGQTPDLLKVGLTYLVPYCVATYGAVTAKRTAWRRHNGTKASAQGQASRKSA